MRRALFVGIDNYTDNPLSGCVSDATRISRILEKNEDGNPNFKCKKVLGPPKDITRAILRKGIQDLFAQSADMALFYFSGHGENINNLGGYLVTPDTEPNDEGVPMSNILSIANLSPVKEIVIILDCCNSGAIASSRDKFEIREGISILTASGPKDVAREIDNQGVFTKLICDALEGGASDIRGEVNAASIYSYCDQTLDAWDQRPGFVSNVSRLTELRMCKPQVEPERLRKITEYFPKVDYLFPLDPSFEPDKKNLPEGDKTVNEANERIFSDLQKYRAARLLVPIGEEHMYYAAINKKFCKLSPLGQFYWKLVKAGQI